MNLREGCAYPREGCATRDARSTRRLGHATPHGCRRHRAGRATRRTVGPCRHRAGPSRGRTDPSRGRAGRDRPGPARSRARHPGLTTGGSGAGSGAGEPGRAGAPHATGPGTVARADRVPAPATVEAASTPARDGVRAGEAVPGPEAGAPPRVAAPPGVAEPGHRSPAPYPGCNDPGPADGRVEHEHVGSRTGGREEGERVPVGHPDPAVLAREDPLPGGNGLLDHDLLAGRDVHLGGGRGYPGRRRLGGLDPLRRVVGQGGPGPQEQRGGQHDGGTEGLHGVTRWNGRTGTGFSSLYSLPGSRSSPGESSSTFRIHDGNRARRPYRFTWTTFAGGKPLKEVDEAWL